MPGKETRAEDCFWLLGSLCSLYRIPFDAALVASQFPPPYTLAIQLVGLATPVFTQVIIDKIVVHQTSSTLIVIGVALLMFMLFTMAMTWLRQYLVLHTGNRIDAVLGSQQPLQRGPDGGAGYPIRPRLRLRRTDAQAAGRLAGGGGPQYGMVEGSVEHVSADSADNNPAPNDKSAKTPPLVYRALVALKAMRLEMDGERFPLGAGMQATAEILLGRRTVMEYLLSPVRKAFHEAGRER